MGRGRSAAPGQCDGLVAAGGATGIGVVECLCEPDSRARWTAAVGLLGCVPRLYPGWIYWDLAKLGGPHDLLGLRSVVNHW